MATVAVAAIVGAVAVFVAGWCIRRVVRPWVIEPIAAKIAGHVREELTDLVAVIVLSPEIQADLRVTIEEVVAHESAVIASELRRLAGDVQRLDQRTADLDRMVRAALPETP